MTYKGSKWLKREYVIQAILIIIITLSMFILMSMVEDCSNECYKEVARICNDDLCFVRNKCQCDICFKLKEDWSIESLWKASDTGGVMPLADRPR